MVRSCAFVIVSRTFEGIHVIKSMIRVARHSLFQQFVSVLIFVGLLFALGDWWNAFELNRDEGINLQKAALVANGFSLYQDIWSDQPPFLTTVLSLVHAAFPFSITAARVVILVFSIVLLTSLFRLVRRFDGAFAAWSAALLLITSQLFLGLSVSVMVGLPAVALALFAIDLATAGSGKSRAPVFLAGMIFAAALLTKLFVFIAFPAFLVAVWIGSRQVGKGAYGALIPRLVWLAAGLAAVVIFYLWRYSALPFDQLVAPHLSARSTAHFAHIGGLRRVLDVLSQQALAPLAFSVVFGAGAFYMRPKSALIIPAVWIVAGIAALSTHQPLWDHQLFVLLPPLAWLGGVGVKSAFRTGERLKLGDWMLANRDPRIVRGSFALMIAGFAALVPLILYDMGEVRSRFTDDLRTRQQTARLISRIVAEDAPGLLITDWPILAYDQRLLVPPELAVWSNKRMSTGLLSKDEILASVAAHPDAPVLLARFAHKRSIVDRIAALTPRTWSGLDQRPAEAVHVFLPGQAMPGIEANLLSGLAPLVEDGIGGVIEMGGAQRFDRGVSRHAKLAKNSVVTRPPGSAEELGACLSAATRIVDSDRLLLAALGVAEGLYCTQTPEGGWANAKVSSPKCQSPVFRLKRTRGQFATFDDDTMPSILSFVFDFSDLLAERNIAAPQWLDEMSEKGLAFAVNSQSPDGSWPQQYNSRGYHALATLNDNAMTGLIRMLVAAYERTGRPGYLEAAIRGGDFLLKAQGGGSQTAFAQQYSRELKPASARTFEPAAYSSLETAYAINALIDLYLATSDERYRAGAQMALSWLEASTVAPKTWSRLYEIGTNRPVYGRRDKDVTYDLSDLTEDEQASYRWLGGRNVFPDIGIALDRMEKLEKCPAAVRAYDAAFRGRALLADMPTSRLWLDPDTAKMDADTASSTRAFADYCAGLVAASQPAKKGRQVVGSPVDMDNCPSNATER